MRTINNTVDPKYERSSFIRKLFVIYFLKVLNIFIFNFIY